MYSCGGSQRWGAPALGHHWVTPPQEALSGLFWAIPLPTAASSAASHPFPAVLCGTEQLWHFLCLTLPTGTSSEWIKHCALVCSAQASQGKGSSPGILQGGCSVPSWEHKATPANMALVVPETSLILGASLAIRTLLPCTKEHLSSSTPAITVFAVCQLVLRWKKYGLKESSGSWMQIGAAWAYTEVPRGGGCQDAGNSVQFSPPTSHFMPHGIWLDLPKQFNQLVAARCSSDKFQQTSTWY